LTSERLKKKNNVTDHPKGGEKTGVGWEGGGAAQRGGVAYLNKGR